MPLTIAVLSDLHLSEAPNPQCPTRRGEFAEMLLLRAVHRLDRFLKPDAVALLGDVVDQGEHPQAERLLRQVRAAMDKLACPYVALPGNHDGSPERFARIFSEAADWFDVEGFRLVPFIDPEEPGFNASRRQEDLDRLNAARQGFGGPLVCLQHVPVLPAGRTPCPYNYTNAAEILSAMAQAGVALSISGHYHPGEGPLEHDGVTLLAAPALCEHPFRYSWVQVEDDGCVVVETHTLELPEELDR
ncbi:MAG: hypothetical protein COZ06_08910 [Armatimonadetes bacterium CG_4_10_14_3_um_filter_66_18]|nr:MAG: hypothetical protein COS65_20965 [Armatimonadetes bacterium CG06_land_8_20_14_3_00_66_21]PIX36879.1 MAG: hypothetical protein COZ57_37210 [Armatimonadetes bacterium CG_4_8_14_3_um_filter_66_20]PIY50522.1 MAG: hypothetical protein COZ06_08910 [Armatimonadetes bacterium CG_4_10_14_3_um_filter_66_18]PIZ33340.1 MAG: hypothetical protein COY42_30110 [Armatimonadetes bacterium CG_4_10_14_0_8_um_filter_66_14]PJB69280.1 MAG: hypothetical protein CO096_13365 [Armatimonadetes bacterium CG_4_9_14_